MEGIFLELNIKDFNSAKDNTINFDYYIDSLDDLKLSHKVHVVGEAINNNGKIEISGTYETEVIETCVRCLSEIVIPLKKEFHGTYLDEREYESYLKSLDSECEVDKDEFYDELIDGKILLDDLVREYIILDLPPYPECPSECQDKSYLDKYKDDGIDPRWQQLLQIKN